MKAIEIWMDYYRCKWCGLPVVASAETCRDMTGEQCTGEIEAIHYAEYVREEMFREYYEEEERKRYEALAQEWTENGWM